MSERDTEAMDAIQAVLLSVDWTPDKLEAIREIVAATGRETDRYAQ